MKPITIKIRGYVLLILIAIVSGIPAIILIESFIMGRYKPIHLSPKIKIVIENDSLTVKYSPTARVRDLRAALENISFSPPPVNETSDVMDELNAYKRNR